MINFATDFHLGTRRQAHTTNSSSAALGREISAHALRIVEEFKPVFLGDLFDKTNNPEAVLVEGYRVAQHCSLILGGNHDLKNRQGEISTLMALCEFPDITDKVVSQSSLDAASFKRVEMPDAILYAVPHHASQAVFEQALLDVCKQPESDGVAEIVLLHCSYNCSFSEGNDASLNLTPEMADHLLNRFDFVLSGHEHNHSVHKWGRLIMLGNHHPTSFSDIADKYVWHYADGEMTKTLVWAKDDGYLQVPYGTPIDSLALEGVQFIDVIGSEKIGTGPEVSSYMNKLRETAPDVFMMRQNVDLIDPLKDVTVSSKPSITDLGARVAADLAGSDLVGVWEELKAESEQ